MSTTIVNESSGSYMSYSLSEMQTFVRYVNDCMKDRQDWTPIDPTDSNNELLERMKDGFVLCVLLTRANPGILDLTSMKFTNASSFKIAENISIALKAAAEIGCVVVNVSSQDIMDGKPHAILGLVWQLLRIDMLNNFSVSESVQVIALKREDESLEQFMKLEDRTIVLRWINYQLKRDGDLEKDIENFGADLKDGTVYVRLLRQVAPHVLTEDEAAALQEEAPLKRAERVIELVDKLNPPRKIFIGADDIVSGNARLNTAFMASIFDTCVDSSLATPETQDPQKMLELRSQILDIALESLAKDLPTVRSAKFTAFIQAAKNLSKVFQSTSSDSPSVVDSLKMEQKLNAELKQQLNQTEEERDELRKQLEENNNSGLSEEELMALQEILKQTEEERDELRKQLEERESEVNVVTEELGNLKLQSERVKELEEALVLTKLELDASKSAFSTTSARLEQTESTLSTMNVNLLQTQDALTEEESKLLATESRIKKLESLVARLSTQLTRTRQDLDYGMVLAGHDAETKLAEHKFGSLDVKSLMNKNPALVGWLYKRGNGVKTWKKRYTVLLDNYLFYYKSTSDTEPRGLLRLDECSAEAAHDVGKPNAFKITVQSRYMYCHAESEGQMQEWMETATMAGGKSLEDNQ